MIAGYPFILNCTAANDPDSPNKIEFAWYQDNKEITNLREIRINKTTNVSQLNIQQLDSDHHSGYYSCVAYNHPSAHVNSSTTIIVES